MTFEDDLKAIRERDPIDDDAVQRFIDKYARRARGFHRNLRLAEREARPRDLVNDSHNVADTQSVTLRSAKRSRWTYRSIWAATAATILVVALFVVIESQPALATVEFTNSTRQEQEVLLVTTEGIEKKRFKLSVGKVQIEVPEGEYEIRVVGRDSSADFESFYISTRKVKPRIGITQSVTMGDTESVLQGLHYGDGAGLIAEVFDGFDPGRTKVAQRVDPNIDYLWGSDLLLPHTSKQTDVSIRWFGYLTPPVAGEYKIVAAMDDGVIVTLGDRKIIDFWRGTTIARHVAPVKLTTEPIFIQVDYHQVSLSAIACLRWIRPDGIEETIPPSSFSHNLDYAKSRQQHQTTPEAVVNWDQLTQEMYRGENFDELVSTQAVNAIDMFAGFDALTEDVGIDHFSIKWHGTFKAKSTGVYEFAITVDDGVRVWIDDVLRIDVWQYGFGRTHRSRMSLAADEPHTIRVEYREDSLSAMCAARWSEVAE